MLSTQPQLYQPILELNRSFRYWRIFLFFHQHFVDFRNYCVRVLSLTKISRVPFPSLFNFQGSLAARAVPRLRQLCYSITPPPLCQALFSTFLFFFCTISLFRIRGRAFLCSASNCALYIVGHALFPFKVLYTESGANKNGRRNSTAVCLKTADITNPVLA